MIPPTMNHLHLRRYVWDRFRLTVRFHRYNALRTAAGGVGQAVRFDLSRALGAGAAHTLPSELPRLAAVDRLAARATERRPAALMLSIDIQIAI